MPKNTRLLIHPKVCVLSLLLRVFFIMLRFRTRIQGSREREKEIVREGKKEWQEHKQPTGKKTLYWIGKQHGIVLKRHLTKCIFYVFFFFEKEWAYHIVTDYRMVYISRSRFAYCNWRHFPCILREKYIKFSFFISKMRSSCYGG